MGDVPVILCAADKADNAFKAHAALLQAERVHPELSRNPYWTMLRQDAFERFADAFQQVSD
jgi:hypothetical protein